jgi:hypothetical protein
MKRLGKIYIPFNSYSICSTNIPKFRLFSQRIAEYNLYWKYL